MMLPSSIRRVFVVLSLLLLSSVPAYAGEHGGGGPGPLSFVVNLASANKADRIAKIDFVLEAASPEVDAAIKSHLPRIQHQVILLLSGKSDENLRSTAGKHTLAEEIRQLVNQILQESDKTGVQEVLFTDFLIQ